MSLASGLQAAKRTLVSRTARLLCGSSFRRACDTHDAYIDETEMEDSYGLPGCEDLQELVEEEGMQLKTLLLKLEDARLSLRDKREAMRVHVRTIDELKSNIRIRCDVLLPDDTIRYDDASCSLSSLHMETQRARWMQIYADFQQIRTVLLLQIDCSDESVSLFDSRTASLRRMTETLSRAVGGLREAVV